MGKIAYDERISAEAGSWLARLQSGDLSFREEVAFQNWLASDPAHATAFEEATSIWDRLGAIPRSAYKNEKRAHRLDRRMLIAGAAALAFGGATLPFLFRSAKAETYKTSTGEQKRVPLTDGTTLLMDTNTCVSVRFDSDVRLLDIAYGRINCRVVKDQRQFAVKAAERLVVGNRSAFDLSYFNDYFSIFMIRGSATIGSAGGSVDVAEGERASVSSSQPLKLDRPDPSSLTAWQTGRLVFKDETIGEAVREMNRYSEVKLEIGDPKLASKRISGGYRTGDNDAFAESLAHLFPLEILHRNGTIQLLGKSTI